MLLSAARASMVNAARGPPDNSLKYKHFDTRPQVGGWNAPCDGSRAPSACSDSELPYLPLPPRRRSSVDTRSPRRLSKCALDTATLKATILEQRRCPAVTRRCRCHGGRLDVDKALRSCAPTGAPT